MVLVTGGTGLVGSHLILRLVLSKIKVRAIYRSQEKLQQVKKVFSYYQDDVQSIFDQIDWIQGDILDLPSLEYAFLDVKQVYHAAALISFDPKDFKKLRKVNVEGTANIVNLCIHHNIEKLCYVSTIGTIGRSLRGKEATEENDWNELYTNVYALTKKSAEMEVWRGTQENLDAVIVNPGVIIGPGFWANGSGKLFTTVNRGYSFYPPGGTGFVSVNDVVQIMMKLMESSIKNERFILVAENLSFKEAISLTAKHIEKKIPSKRLKKWQLKIGRYFDFFKTLITGKPRTITKNSVYSLLHPETYSSTKIRTALGFEFESVEHSIAFSAKKYITEHHSSN
ncbi:NAD-dependent epimerase/dehydratase family protein [Maribacter cobaltidurans]|uniref:NAD-dependent epimerase n=1 Tax=Maribacter cobaltidurans TaxID=1178778 RepID=A0A223V532_9FLAO|nr:NAD-dependent epimerase/dehydratase family protein [Maribacter cobaltidurans]ASV30524.1 NAD-dependent epimerase [Maribacter cobaltidurans]GGD79407.1 NAD-dependent epimerase [Maribacter cobaltidurans]